MKKLKRVTPTFSREMESKKLTQLNTELRDMTELLDSGVYTTSQIYDTVKTTFPKLCNDAYTVKERYGAWAQKDKRPVWKYAVRWALKNNKRNYNVEKLDARTVWMVD